MCGVHHVACGGDEWRVAVTSGGDERRVACGVWRVARYSNYRCLCCRLQS